MITIEKGSLHCLSCDRCLDQLRILNPGTRCCPTCKSTQLDDAYEFYKKQIEYMQRIAFLYGKPGRQPGKSQIG